jgi:hypothetical protein
MAARGSELKPPLLLVARVIPALSASSRPGASNVASRRAERTVAVRRWSATHHPDFKVPASNARRAVANWALDGAGDCEVVDADDGDGDDDDDNGAEAADVADGTAPRTSAAMGASVMYLAQGAVRNDGHVTTV